MEWYGRGRVGFRFHPTEQEIITYFLERKMRGLDFPVRTIEDVVDVCLFEPEDLAQRSPMPKEDRLWYFFNSPVSKYANSKRINRTTRLGFWKVTGPDRTISDEQGNEIGFKKNLVFHLGRVPKAIRTNWVIHEYHSHKAASFPKEYVLLRLKRKSGVKHNTCNEPSRVLAFDSGNRVPENTNTQINGDLFDELLLDNDMMDQIILSELLSSEQGTSNSYGFDQNDPSLLLSMVQPEQGTSNSNGFDHNTPSPLPSMVRLEQGTLFSDGFNNERSWSIDTFLETSEQEDAFVNSLLVDQECSAEMSTNALLHDFNPTKPLSGVYVGDSSDTDTEMVYRQVKKVYQQGPMLETSGLFCKDSSWKEYSQMPMFRAPTGSSSSSDGDAIIELDISSANSDSDLPGMFSLERVVDKLPSNTRICKAQHTPKSHKYFEAQCSTRELQMQSKFSHKEVSNVEMRKNSTMKFGKSKHAAQTTSSRTSLQSSCSSNRSGSSNTKEFHIFRTSGGNCSDGAGSNNGKGSFLSLETPQLSHKTNPPSECLLNVLVSLVLIIFVIIAMAYLH